MSDGGNKKALWKTLQKQQGKYTPRKGQNIPDVQTPQKTHNLEKQIQNEPQLPKQEQFLNDMKKLGVEVHNLHENVEDSMEPQIIQQSHHLPKEQSVNGNQLKNQNIQLNKTSKSSTKIHEKMIRLRILINEMKIEKQTLLMMISDQQTQFKDLIANLILQVAEHFERYVQDKFSQLEEKLKEQEFIISKYKEESGERRNEQQMLELKQQLIFLGQQYEKSQNILKAQQNTITSLQNQNFSLQEMVFDYDQMKVQIQLQVEKRVQQLGKQNAKQYYLQQINSLEEQIEKLSQKCIHNNTQKQYMLKKEEMLQQRQQQLLNRESHLDERIAFIETREIELERDIERNKIKQAEIQNYENNLYKKMEELDIKENQLYVARRNQGKKIINSQAQETHRRRLSQDKGLEIQSRNYNKLQEKAHGSQAYQRPTTVYSSVKNDPVIGRAGRDIDPVSNYASKSKDKIRMSSVNVPKLHVGQKSGVRLNNLGSKLEQLRNQIKKEIDAIK